MDLNEVLHEATTLHGALILIGRIRRQSVPEREMPWTGGRASPAVLAGGTGLGGNQNC